MHRDLRSFLQTLRNENEIVEISAEVDPYLELAEIHRRIIDERGKALLFTNVKGSRFPVATNLFGTVRRIELAFGKRPLQFVHRAVEMVDAEGSLAAYVWRFEPTHARRDLTASQTAESVALSKDLKKRGWRFVGPTTVYAFMQAMGLVNDHAVGCDCRAAVDEARAKFSAPR